ncbi:MAG: beta-galactosidase trimerization domain-containing protein, partial [Lachnospiraceae bacterium]
RNLGKEFLGMTGKFHTTWGEFGGFKYRNALRYECAAMIANGSKCSVGDQLHPSGELDESTYEIVGAAYREVREKEAWCDHVVSAANLAILSGSLPERPATGRTLPGDTGAARILLEAHIPFDIVDSRMDWSRYRFLLLADDVRITPEICEKLNRFRTAGGKLILSGWSGIGFAGKPLPAGSRTGA